MPRNVNPGDIRVGKGLAPEGTVEDNSLRYPERDADPLRVHIHDPSRAHMASSIGIVDAADCYVSDEVEGALQELCGHTGAGRLNGLISGGTFDEFSGNANGTGPIALAGISSTLTLVSPTEVLMNGTVFAASGLTVVLPAAANTYYIYLETEATDPAYRTLVAGTAPPPEVETAGGVENVMFAKVVHDGTDITSWQDARFFVRNLDRKVSYSSRQGENVDAWSEGCFATLEAFFFWAQNYGDTGTSEEEKGTVLIRGTHLVSQSLVVPTDHLQFVGDGEAILLVGNAPLDIFTLSGKSDISFHGINFASQIPGSRGIVATGLCNDIVVENCTFGKVAGVGLLGAVSIGGGAGNNRIRMSGCDALLAGANCFGLMADGGPGQGTATVENCLFNGPGTGTLGTGIALTPGSGGKGASVLNTTIDGFYNGVQCGQMQEFRLTNTVIRDVETGFLTTGQVEHLYVSGCSVYVDDSVGKLGIWIKDNSTTINISDTYLSQPRTNSTDTAGIWIEAPAANPALVVIEGCQLEGFYDSTGNTGHGIRLEGTNADQFRNSTIANCTLIGSPISVEKANGVSVTGNTMSAGGTTTTMDLVYLQGCGGVSVTGNIIAAVGNANKGVCVDGSVANRPCNSITVANNEITGALTHGIHLEGEVGQTTITGNLIDGFMGSAPTSVGIVADGSDNGVPKQGVIDGNIISRSAGGIWIRGFASNIQSSTFTVSNNNLMEIAFNQAQRSETFDGYGTKALACEWATDISFLGNKVTQTGVVRDNTGTPIVFPNSVWSLGVYLRNSHNIMVEDNSITDSQSVATGTCLGIVGHVSGLANTFDMAVVSITDNTVACGDGNGNDEVGVGFYLTDPTHGRVLSDGVIRGNLVISQKGNECIDGIRITSVDINGVSYGAMCDQIQIEGNRLQNFKRRGIDIDLPADAGMNQMNSAAMLSIADNYLFAGGSVADCAGISVICQSGAENGILRNLVVRNNNLHNWGGKGISLHPEVVGGGGTLFFSGCHIDGNTLNQGAADPGGSQTAISVFREGVGYDSVTSLDLKITNNTVGAASSTKAPKQAIHVDLGTDAEALPLQGFLLAGNTTYSFTDDPTLPGVELSYTADGDTPTIMVDYSVDNNRFTNLDAGVVANAFGAVLIKAGLQSFSLSNNHLSGVDSAAANGAGALLSANNLLGTGPAVSTGWRIQGNESFGRLVVGGLKHNIKDVSISGNLVAMTALDVVTTPAAGFAAIEFLCNGINEANTRASNIRIGENVVRGGNIGIEFDVAEVPLCDNVAIVGNNVQDQRSTSGETTRGYGIYCELSSSVDLTDEVSNFSVSNNVVRQPLLAEANHIWVDASNASSVTNLSVCDNKMSGPHAEKLGSADADYPQQASLVVLRQQNKAGSAARTAVMNVDRNEIGPVDAGTKTKYPVSGIRVVFPDASGDATYLHEQVSISHNRVQTEGSANTAGRNQSRGIWIEVHDDRRSPSSMEGLCVDGNSVTMEMDNDDTPLSNYCEGLLVELTCSVRNLSVSNNSVMFDGYRLNRYGMRIFHDFTTASATADGKTPGTREEGVYIVGEAVTLGIEPFDFVSWPTLLAKYRAVKWEGVRVCDNNIMFSAGLPPGTIISDGAYYPEYGALVFQHVRVIFNSTLDTQPPAQAGNSKRWQPVCVPVWGCVMSGNSIRAMRSNGSAPLINNIPGELSGFRTNIVSPKINWPGDTGNTFSVGESRWIQSGWTVTSNSAIFFKTQDTSDPPVFTGQAVRCIIGNSTATSGWTQSGFILTPVAGNQADDDDTIHFGWNELTKDSIVGTDYNDSNINRIPRTF